MIIEIEKVHIKEDDPFYFVEGVFETSDDEFHISVFASNCCLFKNNKLYLDII